MSDTEEGRTDGPDEGLLAHLEEAVGKLLKDHAAVTRRARAAEARVHDLEALLRSFKKGKANPADLQTALAGLTARNEDLESRLDAGREGIDRLLSRIRFLENQS